MDLSVVVHSTGWMHIQHTALLHNWSIYYHIQIKLWGDDTTRHYKYLVPWMLFQCSALAVPSPVTLLVYRATFRQLFPSPLTCCRLCFPPLFFQFQDTLINWGDQIATLIFFLVVFFLKVEGPVLGCIRVMILDMVDVPNRIIWIAV